MAELTWPLDLADLKTDMKIPPAETRDDAALQLDLDAAVGFAVDRKRGKYRFDTTDPNQFDLPPPPADFMLGVLRLAARWNARRRSQDAMVNMQEFGIARVAFTDPDIDRMLRLGRFNPIGFA